MLHLEKCPESPAPGSVARMVTALAGDVEYVDSASLLIKLAFLTFGVMHGGKDVQG